MNNNNINTNCSKNNKNQCPNQKNNEKKNEKNSCSNTGDNNTNNSSTNIKVNNKKLDLRLYEFSYADYVLLSSTIAYAIGEDLNDPDLDILIAFFGMITSDLAILRTRRGIIDGLAKASQNGGVDEGVIGATEAIQAAEDVSAILSRKSNTGVKFKKVKKKKIKKKRRNL